MGRHGAAHGAARRIHRSAPLVLALGIGAAILGGAGEAHAERGSERDAGRSTAQSSDSGTTERSAGPAKRKPQPISASGFKSGNRTGALTGDKKITRGGRESPRGPLAKHTREERRKILRDTDLRATPRIRSTRSTPPDVQLADLKPTRAPIQVRRAPAGPVTTKVTRIASTFGVAPTAKRTGGTPARPAPTLLGVLQLVRRELETALVPGKPAVAPGIPTADDYVSTAYGDIGKWMLKADGEIANWGGQRYGGKTLLEPVNVIIVDPTSTSPAEATRKLNAAMFCAGFPAQPIHSTGFQGSIDEVTYGQQPTGLLQSYSNNFFLFPNDHGRMFGPDPVETSTGYVWSGSFSTEELGIYNGLLVHTYVSSGMARRALSRRLIWGGRATYGGTIALDNSYDTATTTTGDHDGYAVVLVLK